ncbi:DUF1750-domain-containing protein [Massarina eburnea CBS 473.64]|uniref:DUF1750-domain-containing protein n=1 Tax=Massarina eburnea CBS 473.64 TaxID=1395130 RepID=A0A6A6RXA2_9PLEO|nr:DUF1750-domain-containing protein [Massarina eburnea CBS 473.64]
MYMNQAYNAADPSAQVPVQLLPHVHLISSYRFPTVASIQPTHALDYLLKGPAIVKDAAAVAWTFLQAPPVDGTVLLTWQAPRMGTHFASDGLIWGDAEAVFDIPVKGFQLQVLVHKCGYQYPHEPMATHARYRYRVANGPGAFDPNLWLVHYTMSDAANRIPASQIPISREAHAQLQTRAQLQNAGQLVRKEFMLYDSQNWPKVEFTQPPPRGQQAYYNPMQRPQQPYANGPIGQPPAKRQRGPPQQQQVRPTVAGNAMPVDALDEEENTMQDSFDFMTPREISLSRYKQHHEWMEEIFSSPHTIGKIMPIDLGFGLMGELAPLTADILDAPAGDAPIDINGETNPDYKNKVKNYEKLQPEQLKEFETRVSTYLSKEEVEIEKMKIAHAKKVAALKKSRTYIKAERRLRDSYYAPSVSEADREDADPADTVVTDLEKSLGVEFGSKKLVLCVEKGGFTEPQQPQPQKMQTNGNRTTPSASNNGSNEGALEGENTAASLLDQFGTGSLTGTPAGNLSVPALSQPQSQSQSAVATPSVPSGDVAQTSSFDEQAANLEAANDGNDLLDLDVEMSGMTNAGDKSGEADWVIVEGQNHGTAQPGSNTQPPTTNTPSDANALTTSGVGQEPGDMFSGADFGSFDNLDSAGDALADFPGDDTMGLDLVDDSAFGDAFHGMGNDA